MLLVHDEDFNNWVFSKLHPTQGRRFINGRNAIIESAKYAGIEVEEIKPFDIDPQVLTNVHDPLYVAEVLKSHQSNEWHGQRPDLSALALKFVASTLTALDELRRGNHLTAVNLTGAKHHAQFDSSSGFCVFNDFAIASKLLTDDGHRVAILDIDAHHGDGTENLTADNPNVLTHSIHEAGIFPNTGFYNNVSKNVYNSPLLPNSDGRALIKCVEDFIDRVLKFNPDYIFVAGGADGHALDPLSDLQYQLNDYESVGWMLRKNFPNTPMLVGGAGGYRPDDATPFAWASLVMGIEECQSNQNKKEKHGKV